jgi:hypothetical protein
MGGVQMIDDKIAQGAYVAVSKISYIIGCLNHHLNELETKDRFYFNIGSDQTFCFDNEDRSYDPTALSIDEVKTLRELLKKAIRREIDIQKNEMEYWIPKMFPNFKKMED